MCPEAFPVYSSGWPTPATGFMMSRILQAVKDGLLGILGRLSGLGAKHRGPPVPTQGVEAPPIEPEPVVVPQLGTVMVIDDDAVILKSLEMKLGSRGYAVTTVKNVSVALHAISTHSVDIILLDVNFPADETFEDSITFDGLGLLAWLKRFEPTRDIPVISISGSAAIESKALAAGALAFFPKPIDHDRLLEVINGRLHSGKASNQGGEGSLSESAD
jgi:CheY-like chemotaxis protein